MPILLNTDSVGLGVLTGLQFEDEGAARQGKARASTPQQASQTVRMLCSLTSDPQLVGLNKFNFPLNCIQEMIILSFSLHNYTYSGPFQLMIETTCRVRPTLISINLICMKNL